MRFYGGSPLEWLHKMPIALVRVHAKMMDRLIPEEALRSVSIAAVGRHTKPPRGQLDAWQNASRGAPERGVAVSPGSVAGLSLGIGVRIVKRTPQKEASDV